MAAGKKTPLYEFHSQAGARFTQFAGWLMPVQFTSIIEEHNAVRTKAGLFDLCHMGEIVIEGPNALELVQRVTTNDASKLVIGQAQYSLICNEGGGVIDDVLVYRLPDSYMLVVNAANTDKDAQWIIDHRIAGATVRNASLRTGLIAVQGPQALSALQPLSDVDLQSIRYYHFRQGKVAGVSALISRTGYTGEDGFELFCDWQNTEALWKALVSLGNGLKMCGLGARDTLRLEAAMALYGNELNEMTNPFEAGLGWTVKFEKPDFVGREVLLTIRDAGAKRRLVGLEINDRGIARAGCLIRKRDQVIGHVTSGSFSPTLQRSIALGYVPADMAEIGNELAVDVRGRELKARIVPIPFYKRKR